MLLTRRAPPRALFVPALGILAGTAATVLCAAQLQGPVALRSDAMPLIGALLFGAITWMFLAEAAVLKTDGTDLVLRGLWRQRSLALHRSRVGVDYRPGGRSPRFVLMLTDGEAMAELGEWTAAKRAERAAARIEGAFGMDDGSAARRKAGAAVIHLERRWRQQVDETQQLIDVYYESATWRRVKYGGFLLVLVYVAGMIIYIRFWGS